MSNQVYKSEEAPVVGSDTEKFDELSAEEVRQGEKTKGMPIVLVLSILGVVAVFAFAVMAGVFTA